MVLISKLSLGTKCLEDLAIKKANSLEGWHMGIYSFILDKEVSDN